MESLGKGKVFCCFEAVDSFECSWLVVCLGKKLLELNRFMLDWVVIAQVGKKIRLVLYE